MTDSRAATRFRRMDVILIPGFWLDGSSWERVVPAIERAGHRVRALTLPGLEAEDADRRGIGLRDHVDAVVDAIDDAAGPVVLVGHSGGGPLAHAAADARPDRVVRVVHVDTAPLGTGQPINDDLPVVDGEIPLPDWSVVGDQSLRDFDEELKARFRARAIPMPAAVASTPLVLEDERRYDVPATVICCQFPSEAVREWIAEGVPLVSELARMRDVAYVDLPTGHWPQFTKPDELAAAIVAAIEA